ncbi:MAG: bifunctional transcriptional activator/DNA repair enzyme AdaA [Anaerolineales bacterium]
MDSTNTSYLDDYERIAQAVRFIEANVTQQPDLRAVADHLHLSEFHLQRLFRRWVGISPKRFLQYLTAEYAKDLLQKNESILNVAYRSGLSGGGRLHDLMINVHAMTPGEYKAAGAGLNISYGVHATPFGQALLAQTARGVCALRFLADDAPLEAHLDDLRTEWPLATFQQDTPRTAETIGRIFSQSEQTSAQPVTLLLKGTNFQLRVWDALLRIPFGGATTYADVAQAIGKPSATRAVGNAVGANPIAYLIPCHRVLRADGGLSGYRWDPTRKRAILGWEAAHAAP